MELAFLVLILVPLIGLVLVNANLDGFRYSDSRDQRPWYEREKFERAVVGQGIEIDDDLHVHRMN